MRTQKHEEPRVAGEPDALLDAAIEQANEGETRALDEYVLKHVSDRNVSAETLKALGDRLGHLGALDHALKCYLRSLVLDDSPADTWCAAGIAFHHGGQFQKAIGHYQVALVKSPTHSLVHSNLASAYLELGQAALAKRHACTALILDPVRMETLYNLALILEQHLETSLALSFYDRTIRLDPVYAPARTNRGKQRQEQRTFHSALQDHTNALILVPSLAEAMHNRGTVLSELREFEASICAFRRALLIHPDAPRTHLALSMTLLLTGHYREGWAEHEWRFLDPEQHGRRARYPLPALTPESLVDIEGKTVLLLWELGLGDTLHFCRYALLLADLGARVILTVQSELKSLLTLMDPRIEVNDAPVFKAGDHCHAYLMSLPWIFKTEVETIPLKTPYLCVPNDDRIRWAQKIPQDARPRVGLVWSGASAFKSDHNRSLPLSHLGPLLELPVEFHCLQKEVRANDAAVASEHQNLYQYTSEIESFADTAALVSQMDLVISVDTSVAHLAGALGKPLWLMLPYTPDHRWLLDRMDTPWYPTANLYRQDENREWMNVIVRLRSDLIQTFELDA